MLLADRGYDADQELARQQRAWEHSAKTKSQRLCLLQPVSVPRARPSYPAAVADFAATGARARRNFSMIRVPAWAGSRSTLALSLLDMAVALRCPLTADSGSAFTLWATPTHA